MSGWCTTLGVGVADRYCAQGLPWLIPSMPVMSFIKRQRIWRACPNKLADPDL